ncbi:hypothetical protein WJX84_003924 [Apatococcus fuscideae]|uniref:Exostosin GT47 domain-containing protein n=1 Tax=Apatococcus fuscideae TaxID=2026836 RepID=A0AAW1SZ60_9CHLO
MGAGAVQEGWHRAGSNGVARHQNDVLNRWRPPKATESSEHEGRPLVYIYELPAPLLNCSWWNGWATYIYGAEVRVPEVMSGSQFATDDPLKADLFLVPALLYCNDLEHNFPSDQKPDRYKTAVSTTLDWIRYYYPFWDLYNGSDHIWVFTQDHGFCGFVAGEGTMNKISNSIILSHWGLMDYEGHCPIEQRLQSKCSSSTLHHCFDPTKDVVIPRSQSDGIDISAVPMAHWSEADTWRQSTTHSSMAHSEAESADVSPEQPTERQMRNLSSAQKLQRTTPHCPFCCQKRMDPV